MAPEKKKRASTKAKESYAQRSACERVMSHLTRYAATDGVKSCSREAERRGVN